MHLLLGQTGIRYGTVFLKLRKTRFSLRVDSESKTLDDSSILMENPVGRSGNFAEGFFSSQKTVEKIEDRISRFQEAENSQKICLFHSLHGGTGGGLGARLVQDLDFSIETFSCFPTRSSPTGSLQVLNTVLSLSHFVEDADKICVNDFEAKLRNQVDDLDFVRGFASSLERKTEILCPGKKNLYQVFFGRSGKRTFSMLPEYIDICKNSVYASECILADTWKVSNVIDKYFKGRKSTSEDKHFVEKRVKTTSSLVCCLAVNWLHPALLVSKFLEEAQEKLDRRIFTHHYVREGLELDEISEKMEILLSFVGHYEFFFL